MFPINIFLSSFISDHAFSNVYSEKFLEKKSYYKHLIWTFLVFLSFCYDAKGFGGFLIWIIAFGIHVFFDFYRMNKKSSVSFEFINLALMFLYALVFKNFFVNSFISVQFQYYIFGMMLTTSFLSYIFRTFNIIDNSKKDTVGATERLVIYIFMFEKLYIFVLISVICGVLYKLVIEKRKDKEVILSPVLAIIVSYFWTLIMPLI